MFTYHIQVAWYLSQIRPRWQPSGVNFEWWVGLTDIAKTGEFKWRLGEDVKASSGTATTTTTTTMMPAAVFTDQTATTPWPSVEIGPGDAYCGTLDANTTLRGVDCAVGKTDNVVRTILCEAGEDTNENRMNQVSLVRNLLRGNSSTISRLSVHGLQ